MVDVQLSSLDPIAGLTDGSQFAVETETTNLSKKVTWSTIKSTLKTYFDTLYQAANANIQSHISSTSNPHSVTKSDVGLGSVDDIKQMPLSYLDTDNTLAANSDTKVTSQKAVKAYVDGLVGDIETILEAI